MADKENALGTKTIIAIVAVIVLLFIASISVGIFLADKGSSEAVDGNQSAEVNQNTDANNTNTESPKSDENNANNENNQNENKQNENTQSENNNQTGENNTTPDDTTDSNTGAQNNVTTPNNNGTVANNNANNNGTTNNTVANNVTSNNGEANNTTTNNTEVTTGTNVNEVGETTVTRVEEEEKLVSKDFWDWWTPASVLATAASAISDTIVPTTPDFTVEKFATTESGENVVYAGENITYTIKVTNNGEKDLNNIEITDRIPENTTFVSFDDIFNIAKGTEIAGENNEVIGVKWIVSVPGHKENEEANSVFVRFTVNVNKMMLVEMENGEIAEVPTTGTIANTAIANGQESNEEKTAIITSNKTSEITRDGQKVEVAKIGDEIKYTITVTNTGDVDGVTTISDNVPTGTILKENSAEGATISENNTKLEWKNVTVPAGESVSKTFIVIVDNFDDLTENKITNVATVGGKETDEVEDPIAIDITVSKDWKDENDQDGYRPEEIYVNLLTDGKVKTTVKVIADEQGNWSYVFENLPKFENGKEIVYTVTENDVEKYTTEITGSVADGFVITNTHTPEEINIKVKKNWDDNDDEYSIRPTEIQVQLYAGTEKKGDSITLNAENSWEYVFEGLAKKNNGEDILYSVQEVNVPEGYIVTSVNEITASEGVEAGTNTKVYEITNTPNEISNQNLVLNKNVVEEQEDETFKTIDKDQLQNKAYKVGDTVWYSITVENTGDVTASRTVTDTIPTGIKFISVSGSNLVPTFDGNTKTVTWKVSNLSKDESRTIYIKCEVTEDAIKGNASEEIKSEEKQINLYEIENIAVSKEITSSVTINVEETIEFVSKTVKKDWEDNGIIESKPSVTAQLYANDTPKGQPVELNSKNNWEYKWTELHKYDSSNNEISYTVREVKVGNENVNNNETEDYYASQYVDEAGVIHLVNTYKNVTINKKLYKSQTKSKVDVVFVLDVSGSMVQNTIKDGNNEITRAKGMVNAVNQAITTIMENPDNRVGVVMFNSNAKKVLELGHYSAKNNTKINGTEVGEFFKYQSFYFENKEIIKTNVNEKNYQTSQISQIVEGGTYTQSGVALGASMLANQSDTTGRTPMIILLTDGEPTYGYSEYNKVLNDNGDANQYNIGSGVESGETGEIGYLTILTANYYKNKVNEKYNNKARMYTIGIGMSGEFNKAVLKPDNENVDSCENGKDNGAKELYKYLKGTEKSIKYNTEYIWDVWAKRYILQNNYDIKDVNNPYENYNYADGSWSGQMDAGTLSGILEDIVEYETKFVGKTTNISKNDQKVELTNLDINKEIIIKLDGVEESLTVTDLITRGVIENVNNVYHINLKASLFNGAKIIDITYYELKTNA